MKKFLYNNLELIVVLFITFMLFVTLVLFYENKIDELSNKKCTECENIISTEYYYTLNNDNQFEVELTYLDKINNDYIKIKDSFNEELIIKFEYEMISGLVKGYKYKLFITGDMCDVYNVSDLQRLIDDGRVVKVEQL